MKCQILFSRKNKTNIINLLSTESAHSRVGVKNQKSKASMDSKDGSEHMDVRANRSLYWVHMSKGTLSYVHGSNHDRKAQITITNGNILV